MQEYPAPFDYNSDLEEIEKYNARRAATSRTRLQVHMGPSPFDGDPQTARIFLLLNNPGFDPETSRQEDHALKFEGWPLAGLHPDVRPEFGDWYKRPLGELIERYGKQRVSQTVCILQLNPWASMEFDGDLRLPSLEYQLSLANAAIKRGVVVIVGRSFEIWPQGLPLVKNRLNPTISPGNLDAATWQRVVEVFG